MDHILRYQNNDDVKMMVVLGEVKLFAVLFVLKLKPKKFHLYFSNF